MKKNKSYLLITAVLTFLFTLPSTHMLAQENLVDRLNKALNLKLPDNYDAEARKFIEKYKKICQDEDVIDYTEKFIVEQMKEDLGLNKQDQYLFLLSTCFEKCTGDYLYYGADGNDKRLDDYTKVMDNMNQCGEKYEEELKAYLQQLSAEARQQSVEARQQSAEARQQSAEARQQSAEARQGIIDATYRGLSEMVKLYNVCDINWNNVRDEEIIKIKELSKKIIQNCKEYDIDYKAYLHKEIGDEQKLKKILKFYGIE